MWSSEGETLNHPERELAAATPLGWRKRPCTTSGMRTSSWPRQLVVLIEKKLRPTALPLPLLGLFSRSGGFTDFMINISTQICEWGIY